MDPVQFGHSTAHSSAEAGGSAVITGVSAIDPETVTTLGDLIKSPSELYLELAKPPFSLLVGVVSAHFILRTVLYTARRLVGEGPPAREGFFDLLLEELSEWWESRRRRHIDRGELAARMLDWWQRNPDDLTLVHYMTDLGIVMQRVEEWSDEEAGRVAIFLDFHQKPLQYAPKVQAAIARDLHTAKPGELFGHKDTTELLEKANQRSGQKTR